MLEKIITKSTDYLIRNRVIEEDDRDVYEYGFHSLYNNIIDIASILVISIFLHQVPQTALYRSSKPLGMLSNPAQPRLSRKKKSLLKH